MAYTTPGVYVEEISKFPHSIPAVETAIPAFIGYTEMAKKNAPNDLLRVPTRIESMKEYGSFFGIQRSQEITITIDRDNLPDHATVHDPSFYKMYYALQAYFDNGGGPCYIVSVGNYKNDVSLHALGKSNTSTPGGLDLIREIDDPGCPGLILFPDAHALNATDFYTLYSDALEQCNDLRNRFTIIDVKTNDAAVTDPIDHLRGPDGIGNSFLNYGAAYWPNLITKMNWGYNNASIFFKHLSRGPLDGITLRDALTDKQKSKYITEDFIIKMKRAINEVFIEMSPGAHIAGAYATTDRTRGVWKSPANISLQNIIQPVIDISDADQGGLNVHVSGKSVNAIRSFPGRGTLVWGARTLAGNDNEWRYISVRRFFNMVEESVKKGTEVFVFEPNDANTWAKLKGSIENFINLQWKQGALAGAKPENAYFVKVGLGETMTALDIQKGNMHLEIGMAMVRPAEFIILKITHKMQST